MRWILAFLALTCPVLGVGSHQALILKGARACLGDVYDAGYYPGGPPPKGRGACVDVLWSALRPVGVDLQARVEEDLRVHPGLYPMIRDRNIDYRWCPNLIVWFRRHARGLPADRGYQGGDVVFWSLTGDGVADHCGIVSDRRDSWGRWLVIHNFPPGCKEEPVLGKWMVMGHFRL